LGLAAVVVLLSALAVSAAATVDLMIRGMAPTQVDVDSTYVINVSFANKGGVSAPDNWVRVTLPEATQFIAATYIGGAPRPPDEIDGQVLTWHPSPLVADSTWSHILIEVSTAADLEEGTALDVLAEIGGSAPEDDMSNNSATITSVVQEMGGSQKRVHVRTVMPADVLEYTITIEVPEEDGRQWVTMIDELPLQTQVRFLGWDGTPQGELIDGYRLRWEGWVDPGEPVQLRYRLGVEADVPPGTGLENVATVEWHGHREQLGPVVSEVEVPYGVLGVGPEQGGQIEHNCGATLTVPPGAVHESTRFEVGPLDGEVTPPAGWQYANRAFTVNAFRFGEPVRQFDAPLTIAVEFSDEDVVGLNRESLRLWTREGLDGPWAMMDEPVRAGERMLVHTTTHLSEFALFGVTADAALADLEVRAMAPSLVDAGSTYVVNVSYANKGGVNATDNWVRVTLPLGAQFVASTYVGGADRPPDEIDGQVLTWYVEQLVADSTWGHILIEVEVDEGLAGGTPLEVLAEIGGSVAESDMENNQVLATTTIIEPGPGPEAPFKVYLSFIVR
jgi:hypothetical protein